MSLVDYDVSSEILIELAGAKDLVPVSQLLRSNPETRFSGGDLGFLAEYMLSEQGQFKVFLLYYRSTLIGGMIFTYYDDVQINALTLWEDSTLRRLGYSSRETLRPILTYIFEDMGFERIAFLAGINSQLKWNKIVEATASEFFINREDM